MKIKIIFAAIILVSIANVSIGQDKIEKYCEVTIREGLVHKIFLDLGHANNSFRDSMEAKKLIAVKHYDNAVDVLDYMQKIGWEPLSASYIQHNSKKVFYFKKIFDKSEFKIDGN